MQQNTRLPIYILIFSGISFTIVSVLYLTQTLKLEIKEKSEKAQSEYHKQQVKYEEQTKPTPIPKVKELTTTEEFDAGLKALAEKKNQKALKLWNKVFKTDPQLFKEHAKKAANLFFKYKQYRDTLTLIEQYPETFSPLFKAKCHKNLQDFSNAEKSYLEHLATNPNDVKSRKELYSLYQMMQETESERGKKLLQYILEVDQDPDFIKQHIKKLMKQAVKEKKTLYLEKALLIDPKNPRIHLAFGDMLLKKNKYAEARNHFIQSQSFMKKKSQKLIDKILDTYLTEYRKTGNHELVDKALQKYPKEAKTIELELNHLLKTKDYGTLFEKLEEAKQLFPTTPKFKQFENQATRLYKNDSIETRFSMLKRIQIQLGVASFSHLDKKFAPLNTLEEQTHTLQEFANCLKNSPEKMAFFLAKEYQGTSLAPLESKTPGIVRWSLEKREPIAGQEAAILNWTLFATPFQNETGQIQFTLQDLPTDSFYTTEIRCTTNDLQQNGLLKLKFVKEERTWKIAELKLLKMETQHTVNPWFKEIPLPIRNNQKNLTFGENKNLEYHEVYDLVLSGISTADYNNDGWLDLYFSHRGENLLLKNLGDGTFEDVTLASGAGNAGDSRGSTFIDYDQDGHLDLFVCNYSSTQYPLGNTLYHNNGNGTFTDITESTGLSYSGPSMNASWGDLDRDNDLDLVITCFGDTEKTPYQFIGNRAKGVRNLLYINQGDGTFVEKGMELGFHSKEWSYGTYIGDLNQDNLPDIYVLNEFGPNQFYLNQGELELIELGLDFNLRNYSNTRSLSNLDLDQDGILDLIQTNLHSYYSERILQLYSALKGRLIPIKQSGLGSAVLKNNGKEYFRNISKDMGLSKTGSSYGCAIGELTNELTSYAYFANGHYSSNIEIDTEDYEWRRFLLYQEALERKYLSAVPSGYFYNKYRRLLNLAQRESHEKNKDFTQLHLSFKGHSQNQLFQIHGATSQELAFLAGLNLKDDSRGVLFADLDRDGDLDLLVQTLHEVKLFRNDGATFKGTLLTFNSTKPIYGTKVELTTGKQKRTRWIHSGEGFLTQFPTQLHFGLGKFTKIDELKVHWPDGKVQSWQNIENPGLLKIQYNQQALENIPLGTTSSLGKELESDTTEQEETEKKEEPPAKEEPPVKEEGSKEEPPVKEEASKEESDESKEEESKEN